MTATGAEFSADVGRLGHFAETGELYVQNLERIVERVAHVRSVAAVAIGAGTGPDDLSSRAFRELLAEAAISTAYVTRIRDSLLEFGGPGTPPAALLRRIDRDLRSSGLPTGGDDRPLGHDLATVELFRARRLEAAGVAPGDGTGLARTASGFGAALVLLAAGVHPDAVVGAEPARLGEVASLVTTAAAGGVDQEALEALLTDRYPPGLRRAVLAGTVAPPTDADRESVVAAMVAGLGPSDMGIPAVYVPASYRRFLDLGHEIGRAEIRREVADSSSPGFQDADEAALAAVEQELAALRAERDALAAQLDIDDRGMVGGLAAVAATSAATAGSRWEGETYAFHVNGFHDRTLSRGGLFGRGRGVLGDPDGHDVELRQIGARLAPDPAAAVAFYNGIGVTRAANLATVLAGNHLRPVVFDRFGLALAGASAVTRPDGSAALAFSGWELLRVAKPDTEDGIIWYSPATLFTTGAFAARFVADASRAVLTMAEEGNDQGIHSHLGRRTVADPFGAEVIRFDGGEDPRNILLARTAEDPAATRSLLLSLVGPRGRGWSGHPAPGRLDPILRPRVPFGPTLEPGGETGWVDRLRSRGLMDGVARPPISPVSRPQLRSDYPITSLLGAAAARDDLSRWILLAIADSVTAGGAPVQDPGTAAGLDLIMANHATLLFAPAHLQAVGIHRTTLNARSQSPVRGRQWRAVHGEVLRFGRGQALAGRIDRLLNEAIVGSVDADGWFHGRRPRALAQMAARSETVTYEALFAYAARLDQQARDDNRRVNLAVSAMLSLIGVVPAMTGPASLGSAGWAWFFTGYPTDNELAARTEAWTRERSSDDGTRWNDLVFATVLDRHVDRSGSGSIELTVPGLGPRTVSIRAGGTDPQRYEWQHPDSGVWSPVPGPGLNGYEDLFAPYPGGPVADVWTSVTNVGIVREGWVDGHRLALAHHRSGPAAPARLRSLVLDRKTMDAIDTAGWTSTWIGQG